MRDYLYARYNPSDWYWLKSDNTTLYSSAQQKEVTTSDPQYLAWIEQGYVPSWYPKDTQGNDSREELVNVLKPYGLRVYPLTSMEQIQRIQEKYQPELNDLLQALSSATALGDEEDIADCKAEYQTLLDEMTDEIRAVNAQGA